MKTIQQILTGYCLIFLLPFFITAQENKQNLTIEEAFLVAKQQNPVIQRGLQQIKQKEFESAGKNGLRLPQFSLSAKAVAMSDNLELDLTPVRDAITPLYTTLGNYGVFSGVPNPDPATNPVMPILPDNVSTQVVRQKLLEGGEHIANANWVETIQEKNFATVSADFLWPVFTGGKINNATKAAKVEVKLSEEELRNTEGELLTEVVSRYYGLTLALQAEKVREQMFMAMEKHYADAQKFYENGIIAKVELLHAQVSKNEAERELKKARHDIRIIHAGLDASLSYDTAVVIQPLSNLFINNEIPEVSYWTQSATLYNPQLKQIEGKKELTNIKKKADQGNYFPSVAMMGTYNLVDKNYSPYLPEWLVGVGVKWTVFDGLDRKHKINADEAIMSQVGYAEQKAHTDLKAYIIKLTQELEDQKEQKTELDNTLELANEYASSTEKAFSEGLVNSTSVVEAHSKVAQVKALRLKLLYDYDVTLAKLFQTAGIPGEFFSYTTGSNTFYESFTE
jgi:outer membrane protein TolC